MNLLGPSPSGKPTVLLVDDSRTVLAMYGSALATEGFAVLKASTTAEAMGLIKNTLSSIELLATDLVLPETLRLTARGRPGAVLHGLELARQATQVRPDMKTILFSGQPEEMLKRGGLATSSLPFLRKPFSVEVFLRTVRTVLNAPLPERDS